SLYPLLKVVSGISLHPYFPKNTDLDLQSDQEIETYIEQLNNRPRKVLGWKTPSEVFMGKKLHLS
ncbi:hypothetical protein IOD71_07260, partial [Lactobacillus sp. MYD3]|nr:hypothetical protein [Lacticaseibacillus paracasei]